MDATCRASVKAVAPVAARRWGSVLMLFLSVTGGAAFADTDDRHDGSIATSATMNRTAPALTTVSISLAAPDTTALQDASNPAASTIDRTPTAQKSIAATTFGNALDAEHLEGQRGGAETAPALPVSAIFSNGAVADNRAVNVITGSSSIRDGAFANASGLPIVIQNTGANVLIQNATIVNVQLR